MNWFQLELLKNGNKTGNYFAFAGVYDGRRRRTSAKYGGSNSLVLRLDLGDTVEIQYPSDDTFVKNLARRSSFSGILVVRGNAVKT